MVDSMIYFIHEMGLYVRTLMLHWIIQQKLRLIKEVTVPLFLDLTLG